jgi:mitogen-activated protein kinase 1/3
MKRSFRSLYPDASANAVDFLIKTLTCKPKVAKLTTLVDPRRRIDVDTCLSHPYLEAYHDPEDEPNAKPPPVDFFDIDKHKSKNNKEDLKRLLRVFHGSHS